MSRPNERRLSNIQNKNVGIGSSLVWNKIRHKGKTMKFDTLAGSTLILPTSTGSGEKIRCQVTVVPTSNAHVAKVNNTTDIISGTVLTLSDNSAAVLGYSAGASDDTVSLNGTTTGGLKRGDYFELEDSIKGVWLFKGVTTSSGTEATPFSATV